MQGDPIVGSGSYTNASNIEESINISVVSRLLRGNTDRTFGCFEGGIMESILSRTNSTGQSSCDMKRECYETKVVEVGKEQSKHEQAEVRQLETDSATHPSPPSKLVT